MDPIKDFVKILQLKRYCKQTFDNYKSQLQFLKLHLKNKSLKNASDQDLFEGQKGGKYSSESAGQLFKRAVKRAKIKKNATLYTLRHSFATHLLEDGIGIAHTQNYWGMLIYKPL